MYDADELEKKIDRRFQEIICEPRRSDIVQFYENFLMFKDGFQLMKSRTDLEVVDVFFYANAPLEYLFAQASLEFYDDEYQCDCPNLNLKRYNYFEVEELVKETVQAEGISLTEVEESDFDSAKYWENQHDLEMKFLIDCWKQATTSIQPKFRTFLNANDGSGIPIDLDTGNEVSKEFTHSVEGYLMGLGVYPKKMLIEREEDVEPISFWKRLFGRKTI